MKSLLVKGLVGLALAGTMTLGVVSWTGGQTVTNTIEKTQDAKGKLEQYKSNEIELVNKISTLKQLVTDLEEQIKNGGQDKEALLKQIAELNTEIDGLEAQLAEAQEEKNSLTAEIERLTGELNLANEDAARLQTEIDNFNLENYNPLTPEQLAGIVGDNNIVDPGTGDPGQGDPGQTIKTWNITSSNVYEDEFCKLEKTTVDDGAGGQAPAVKVTNKTTGEQYLQPIGFTFERTSGGNLFRTVGAGATSTFEVDMSNVTKITVAQNNGAGSVLQEITIVK